MPSFFEWMRSVILPMGLLYAVVFYGNRAHYRQYPEDSEVTPPIIPPAERSLTPPIEPPPLTRNRPVEPWQPKKRYIGRKP